MQSALLLIIYLKVIVRTSSLDNRIRIPTYLYPKYILAHITFSVKEKSGKKFFLPKTQIKILIPTHYRSWEKLTSQFGNGVKNLVDDDCT